jgi:hypothetical protein
MGVIMDTIEVCRAEADDCLRRADTDTNANDKPLWVTLAQSWLQLAQDANRMGGDKEARTPESERDTAEA